MALIEDVYSEVHPVMVQANETLTVAEVYNFLSNANSKYGEYISNADNPSEVTKVFSDRHHCPFFNTSDCSVAKPILSQ